MSSERVLIWLKRTYLGDAVMAAPLLDGMAELVDQPCVLAGPAVSQVLADRSHRVEFLMEMPLGNPLSLLRQARALRKLRLDCALLVNRSFRSALCARAAGIRRRIGHGTEGRGPLLTSSLPYDTSRFEANCYLDLARSAGYDIASEKPRLTVTEAERMEGSLLTGGAKIGVQPGARYDSKRIPAAVLAEVASRLLADGRRLALLGGREEARYGEELTSLIGTEGVTDLIGKTGLRGSMGALAGLEMVIGSDTGMMHLAAGLGTPTVTVFGPNPMSKWGHDYPPHRPIQAPGGQMSRITSAPILEAIEGIRRAASMAG